MKLYTEEQVRKAMQESRYAFSTEKGYDEILDSLTPIELPSDEDAAIAALKIAETLGDKLNAIQEAFYLAGFTTCNQWLNKQILNQNK